MKVGDLVKEITRMKRVRELGIIIAYMPDVEVDQFLVEFNDSADWMSKHHLELINESR